MRLTIRTDGGARGNPGPAAAGVVISDPRGQTIFAGGFHLGETTNNVAEYEGMLRGLSEAKKLGGTDLTIYSDSELMVRQINGDYRVKSPKLQPLYRQVMDRIGHFEKVTVLHVKRHENQQADGLVNRALDSGADVNGIVKSSVPIENEKNAIGRRIELSAKLPEHASGQYRETLFQEGSLATELICLTAGQTCTVNTNWSWATVTVLRGRGVLVVGSEEQFLKPASWLHLNNAGELEFSAAGDEHLVIILTGAK